MPAFESPQGYQKQHTLFSGVLFFLPGHKTEVENLTVLRTISEQLLDIVEVQFSLYGTLKLTIMRLDQGFLSVVE